MSACHNPNVPPGFKSAEDKILLSIKIVIVGQTVSLKKTYKNFKKNLYSFYYKIFEFLFQLGFFVLWVIPCKNNEKKVNVTK